MIFRVSCATCLLIFITMAACKKNALQYESNVASISIRNLDSISYDQLHVLIMEESGQKTVYDKKTPQGTSQQTETSLPVGTYTFTLNYLKGTETIVSTDYCQSPTKNNQKTLS